MSRTQWNDREDEAMHGLPWIAQLIYLRALRPHMDYSTGIVGVARGISLKGIAETLHIEHGQGRRDAGDPSQKAVRHALELLEREGLIKKLQADRQLVFRLPLADVDSSVQKKWGRRGADVGQTKTGTPESSNGEASPEKWGRRGADHDTEKWGTPPESGIRDKSEANASPCRAGEISRFAEFWDAWPKGQRKRDRHKAEQAWKRHGLDAMADAIIADVQRRAVADQQWLRGYAPMPTTYINGRRWEDELESPGPARGTSPDRRSVVDHNRAALDAWASGDAGRASAEIIEGEFRREKC